MSTATDDARAAVDAARGDWRLTVHQLQVCGIDLWQHLLDQEGEDPSDRTAWHTEQLDAAITAEAAARKAYDAAVQLLRAAEVGPR